MRLRSLFVMLPPALGALGCGDRGEEYDARVSIHSTVSLERAAVIADSGLSRLVVLQGDGAGGLRRSDLPVGQNVERTLPDVTGNKVLALSRGVQPRLQPEDELPSLTVVDASEAPRIEARYELSQPLSSIELDPQGKWAVLFGGGDQGLFVNNPNQLVLIDLQDPEFEPVTKTIRSFGSAPERFHFTEELDVPGGARRYLIVETSQDVSLVDLGDLSAEEITIPLPQTQQSQPGRPAQVVAHPGVADEPEDALLAIRLESDENVVMVEFAPSPEGRSGDFNLTLNLVDVGAPPSEIAFVETQFGVRLAALVPRRLEASLVDPATTRVERVALPNAFDRMSRVPAEAFEGEGEGDTALLWAPQVQQVGLWALGRGGDRGFRGVDVLNLSSSVAQVLDVPGRAFGHRKLLRGAQSQFFVLDLDLRQSFPMLTNARSDVSLRVAPDGLRAWAFSAGQLAVAQIDLGTLEPRSLSLERPVSDVFDIAVGQDGERALIVLHRFGSGGATVLDAQSPDAAATRFFPGLLLGGAW